jgi:serine/threonine protein kinase
MVISTYILGRKLGQGANAVVHEVTAEHGQRYAAKMIDKKSLKGDSAKLKIMQEVKLHKLCRHNNIIQI